jgi:hypothetical protein
LQNIRNEKNLGYALLAIGLIVIFISVYFMINVFTGGRSPPVLVHFSDIAFPVGPPEEEIIVSLISGQTIDQLTAISFWYILMFFLVSAGGRIASLGVSLIKEPKVK